MAARLFSRVPETDDVCPDIIKPRGFNRQRGHFPMRELQIRIVDMDPHLGGETRTVERRMRIDPPPPRGDILLEEIAQLIRELDQQVGLDRYNRYVTDDATMQQIGRMVGNRTQIHPIAHAPQGPFDMRWNGEIGEMRLHGAFANATAEEINRAQRAPEVSPEPVKSVHREDWAFK